MKKLMSILLALCLLTSAAPAVLAAPDAAPENLPVGEFLVTDSADEIFFEEAPELEEEPQEALDAKTQHRLEEAAARAELAALEKPVDDDSIDLLASNSVTVTVNFPQAASENGTFRIHLYVPGKTDENGFVTEHPYSYTSKNVAVTKGNKSVSATFSVPNGKYLPAVYSMVDTGSYLRQYLYFNADGSVASNEYTASAIQISGDKKISITLPKAERTISGTVRFTKALSEDTDFEVRAYSTNGNIYRTYQGEKGDTSFDFSIPIVADSCRLRIYNNTNGNGGYYDIYGGISEEYDYRAYISTFEKSAQLTIDGDSLFTEYEGGEEIPYTEVNLTVKLPEALTQPKDYAILFFDADNGSLFDYNFYYLQKDATKIEASYWLEANQSYYIGYMDVTDWNSFYWEDDYALMRFQSKDSGITSLKENAKTYEVGEETLSVTIDDTSNYKLTGTLKLSRAKSTNCTEFVFAEFENGERFGARLVFYTGETSVDYEIYVPQTQNGTFDHWAADADGQCDLLVNEDSRIDGKSYTVKNKLALDPITIPVPDPNVTGTLSLPNGMKAPKGGLAFEFAINYNYAGHYYMAEGQSSVDFAFVASLNENDANDLSITTLNAPSNLQDSVSFYFEEDASLTDLDVTLLETVTVSGVITVPNTAKELGTTFRLYTNYNSDNGVSYNNNIYVSVPAGETTAAYRTKAPKNVELSFRVQVYMDATGQLLAGTQYLQPNGTFSNNYKDVTFAEDTEANITLKQGQTISGTISLASGLASTRYSGTVYASPEQGGTNYNASFNFTGTSGTYSLAVPTDYTGGWKVYIDVYNGDSSALLDTQLYYTKTGVTFNRSDAASVIAPATGIDFVIPRARTISGSVILPDAFNGFEIWGNVYAYDNENRSFSDYINTSDSMDYSLRIPTDYTGTYTLAVRLNADEDIPGLITRTYLYLTEDGSLSSNKSDAKEFTVGDDGLTQDLEVPVGKSLSVTLNAPATFSGAYEGYLYLYDLTNYSESAYKNFEFNGTSTTVSLPVPTDGNYTLRLYLYSGPGVNPYTNYYYNNGTWVTDDSNAAALDLSASSISVTLPKAKIISGKLVSAQGDAIYMPEDNASFTLYNSNGSSVSSRSTIDAEGNFVLTIADDLSGNYQLRCSTHSGDTNIVSNRYYYKSDATGSVTQSGSDATYYFTIGDGDVSGLKIYVDTGYVMTGTVKLGNGVTLSGFDDHLGSVDITAKNTETSKYYSTSVSLTSGDSSWSYSIVVPKENATFDLSSAVYLNNDTTSNLYTETIEHGTVQISGSTTLPEITLDAGKHTVNVTITSPIANYLSGYLYLMVDSGEDDPQYSTYISVNGNSSGAYTLTTSPNETATTYRLAYYLYNGNGIVCNKYVYVAADGTLTTDESNAGVFTFGTSNKHSFTFMEQPPYVSGKIYLPEDLDDDDFYLYLNAYSSSTITVEKDAILKDEQGRAYVPYALYNANVNEYTTFRLQYSLGSYDGTTLYFNTSYLKADGTCTPTYSEAYTFSVPSSGMLTLDFTLATWNDGAEENILQSVHGARTSGDTVTYTYTYTYPGAQQLAVTFHPRTDTTLNINGMTYYSYSLSRYTKYFDVSQTNGTLTISMDVGSYSSYGFGITKIVPSGSSSEVAVPTVASVYAAHGSEESIVLNDLRDGETVWVSMAAPATTESQSIIAAIYDGSGKMLDVIVDTLTFSDGCGALALDFENVEDAASLQILFVDSNWAPQMAGMTLGSNS